MNSCGFISDIPNKYQKKSRKEYFWGGGSARLRWKLDAAFRWDDVHVGRGPARRPRARSHLPAPLPGSCSATACAYKAVDPSTLKLYVLRQGAAQGILSKLYTAVS